MSVKSNPWYDSRIPNPIRVLSAMPDQAMLLPKRTIGSSDFKDQKWTGWAVDMAQEIFQRLHVNFTIRNVFDRHDLHYGMPDSNGTFSGPIGRLQAGDGDILICGVHKNVARVKGFHVVHFYEIGVDVLTATSGEKELPMWDLLLEFSWNLWLVISLALFAICFIQGFCEIFATLKWGVGINDGKTFEKLWSNRWALGHKLGTFIWSSCSVSLQQGESYKRWKSFSARAVRFKWAFLCILLVSAYEASNTSMLAIGERKVEFNSFEELLTKKALISSPLFFAGANFSSSLVNALAKQVVHESFVESEVVKFLLRQPKGVLLAAQTWVEEIYLYAYQEKMVPRDACRLVTLPGTFDSASIHWVFLVNKSNFILSEKVRAALIQIRAQGRIGEIMEAYFPRALRCSKMFLRNEYTSTMEDFTIVAIVYAFAVIVAGLTVLGILVFRGQTMETMQRLREAFQWLN